MQELNKILESSPKNSNLDNLTEINLQSLNKKEIYEHLVALHKSVDQLIAGLRMRRKEQYHLEKKIDIIKSKLTDQLSISGSN